MTRKLLYHIRSAVGEQRKILIPFSDGTAFARLCIEFGVDIIGISEPCPGTPESTGLCRDYNAALADLVAGPYAESV